jgi:molybdopterin/thiamine biosynthesis adenylyltransferase
MARTVDVSSRFHRQALITWWDQSRLQSARILVVGAGALGNEVVKNLALVGVGSITVCDMDAIENSNLARCVFFRESDLGKLKAEVLADRADQIYSGVSVTSVAVAVQRLGIGYLRDFDLIIGALDNREARAWVNQACRKLGKTWIDGAIEGLRGVARVFPPHGACYFCTLSEADFKHMSHRRSCALLSPEDLLEGKTPTNATTASIIAGVQAQEAIKFLVGGEERVSLNSKAWIYTGDSMESFHTSYLEDEFCLAHDRYEELIEVECSTLDELLDFVTANHLTAEDQIYALDFEEELITILPCTICDLGDEVLGFRSSLPLGASKCQGCGAERGGSMAASVLPDHKSLSMRVADLGFALRDVITVRTLNKRLHLLIAGAHG